MSPKLEKCGKALVPRNTLEFGTGVGSSFEGSFPFLSTVVETLMGSMKCLSKGSVSC